MYKSSALFSSCWKLISQILLTPGLLIVCAIFPIAEAQSEQEKEQSFSLLQTLQDGFSYRFYTQVFGVAQQPADSSLNANNRFKIPRYTLGTDIRPDLFFESEYIDASLKPRMELRASMWEDGFVEGESQTDVEFFIYEGAVTLKFNNEVFVSYGRENLQWGPSSLLSPSNPFNPNNNQNTPATEMQGMDYAKLSWVPTFNFSASFLANTGAGRLNQLGKEFHNTYALKLDYTGDNFYLSLIPSYQEHGEEFRLGYIGQWNITDALLVYSEGSVFEQRDDFSLLFGGAYTFEFGGTLALEYFHHDKGCTLEPVSLCLTPAYEDSPVGTYLRKDYLQFKYYDVELFDNINLMLRWTYGVNDHSNFAVGYVQYGLGDNFQLFGIVTGGIGGYNGELSGYVDYSVTLGVGYSL